jgi:hypothetical protein
VLKNADASSYFAAATGAVARVVMNQWASGLQGYPGVGERVNTSIWRLGKAKSDSMKSTAAQCLSK